MASDAGVACENKVLPWLSAFLSAARILFAAVLLATLPGIGGGAWAQGIDEKGVSANWSLVPSDLSVGDRFRLLFITSTQRNAESTDIDDYNAHVQNAATLADDSIIRSYSDGFRVLGCTTSVNARTNTETTSGDTDAFVYWLDGEKVADTYADLYDGSWDSFNRKTEDADDVVPAVAVYTGCLNNGNTDAGEQLGASHARFSSDNAPFKSGFSLGTFANKSFYALSQVFLITDVPDITDVSVTSTPTAAADTYGGGGVIEITVRFDEPVTVTGDPHFEFSLGNSGAATPRDATYASGSGTDRLVFRYTVQADDEDNNGIWIGQNVVILDADDAIRDGDDNDALLTHTGKGTQSGHKVDGSLIPRVIISGISLTSAPMVANAYRLGEAIEITVTFEEAVTVTGNPSFRLRMGNASGTISDKDATYVSGSGTDALVFRYTVQVGDEDDNGIWIEENAVILNAGDAIQDGNGDDALLIHTARGNQNSHKVDGSLMPPVAITDVSVTSMPTAAPDTYGLGEAIEITVTFEEAVTVTGNPSFRLRIGNTSGTISDRDAAYDSGSGADALVFRYTVQADDEDDNGIWLEENAVILNAGDAIRDGDGDDALLIHTARGNQNSHKVDGMNDAVAPVLQSAVVDGVTLSLGYDDMLDGASVPAAGAFTVTAGGAVVALSGSDPVSISGAMVTLTLAAPVAAGEGVTVSYTAPSGPGAAPIRNGDGNNAAALSNHPVDNVTTPVLALSADPDTIAEDGGASVVTVEITNGVTFAADQTITLSLGGTATAGDDYTVGATVLTLAAGEETASTTVTAVADVVDDDGETVEITAARDSTGIGSATITITDDDAAPVLELSADPSAIAEDGGASVVTVEITNGVTFAADQTITLALSGTATAGDDYTVGATTLTLVAGEETASTTVTAVSDAVDDDGETIILTATRDSTGIGSATVTITDDDAAPELELSVDPAAIAEDGGASVVTVEITNGVTFAADQTITLSLGGTATAGDDYTVGATTLTLVAGEETASTTVTATHDTVDDDGETVEITAARDSTGIGSATITITDDDAAPVLALSADPAAIAEDGGASVVTVEITNGVTFAADQTITLSLGGTATAGDDYTVGATTLTLAAGEETASTTVTAVADVVDDDGETVEITAARDSTGIGSATITITDDDAAPVLALSADPSAIAEDGGASVVTVEITNGVTFAADQTITLSLGGTATAGDDYTVGATVLTLVAGEETASTTVTATHDTVDDDGETVEITAARDSTGIGSATITITDDDAAPVLALSADPSAIAEDGGASVVTVEITNGVTFAEDQTITLALGGTATVTDDYTVGATVLTLVAGEEMASTTVTAVADAVDDDGETVVISAAHDGTGIGSATITITDDDAAPVLALSVSSDTIAEAAGTSTVTVAITNGVTFDADQTITLTLGGTATAGDDYTVGATTLTLVAGEEMASTTVTATHDTVDDDGETVEITAARDSTGIGSATITITDDDAAPVLALSADPSAIAEDGGASVVTVEITNGVTFAADQTITLALGGTATAGDDYTVGATVLTLVAGEETASTTVTATHDTVDDDGETVVITAARDSTGIGSATITITDDDAAPVLSLSADPSAIAEDGGASVVTVEITNGVTFAADQTITLSLGGTATAGDDYTVGATVLTLVAGEETASTTVTATHDTVDDDGETVVITAARDSTGIGSATITITDDDAAPVLALSADPAAIAEDGGASVVTVEITNGVTFAADQTITLSLGGTATAGDDYTVGATVLTLVAGEETASTTVTATHDTVDDDGETVVITAARDSTGIGSATITITDDDAAPVLALSADPAAIAEDGGASVVTVEITNGVTFAGYQTITLALSGTATAGDDYTVGATTLTLAAGEEMASTTVTAVADAVDDDGETVEISATHDSTGIGSATITITDDDAAPVLALSADPAAIAEDGGASVVTVEITNGVTFAADQMITLSLGGTATAGDDYTVGATVLTLAAGEETASTTVTAVADVVDDDGETVEITAARDSTGIGSATITITDDDAAPVLALSVDPDTIAEDGGASVVTVEITNGVTFAADQTITLSLGGTATAGDDYTVGATVLTLVAGEETASTTVTATHDTVDDDGETVEITAARDSTGIGSATITITDDDAAPVLALSVDPDTIAEDGGASVVTVEITNGVTFAADQTITLSLGGTATVTDDYTVGATTLTLVAGEETASTTVTAVADVVDDDGETIILTATRDSTGIGSATITITDDDAAPVLALSVDPDTIAEDGGASVVTVEITNGVTFAADQTITLSLGGTATVTDDYTVGATTLTLVAGEETASTTVTAVADVVDDDGETIILTATRDSTGIGSATITITDDDAAPELELLVSEAVIDETGGVSIVMVRSVNGVTFPADQMITLILGGTATMGNDYMIDRPDLTLTLAAGMAESAPITLTAMDDTINDGDEMVEIVAMRDGTPVGAMQTVMIAGDDDPDMSDLEAPRKEEATVLLRRHVDRFASVSSGAALGRLQGLAPPTTVNAQISARNHKLDASWTGEGAKGSGWAGWSRLFYGWVEGPGDGTVYDLYLGVDWRAPDGRYVIGGMLGHEGADLRLDEGGRFRSQITQVGLYGATYLSDALILDGALAYGFGRPELSQIENGNEVRAKYDTRRLTLRADLTGGLNWRDGAMVIEPQFGVLHVRENLGAFTDSAGVSGAAETLRLTRFGVGPRLTWALPGGVFTGRARVNWDRHNLDDKQASDLSASLDARLRYDLEGGLSAEFFGAADGIGLSGDQQTYTAGVSISFRF